MLKHFMPGFVKHRLYFLTAEIRFIASFSESFFWCVKMKIDVVASGGLALYDGCFKMCRQRSMISETAILVSVLLYMSICSIPYAVVLVVSKRWNCFGE